jgi:hypothetical protein
LYSYKVEIVSGNQILTFAIGMSDGTVQAKIRFPTGTYATQDSLSIVISLKANQAIEMRVVIWTGCSL